MIIKFSELHLKVGEEIGTSNWLEITQERIDKFAEATGDYQWIHVDVERANREIGGTIAHGYLIISLIPVFFNECLQIEGMSRIVNFGSDRIRLKNAVKTGSRVRLKQVCESVKNSAGGKIVKIKNTIEIEGEKRPALVGETLQILYGAELETQKSDTDAV
ncbi:MaoC family dehydratase [Hirschia baltica]|uniref:MaoC domain protein dehydratase n=1 Tax=Hirschia baltica (strain ATCC 49814 / DSM 5838 / IFAM 1418) TaxID=582402 RepID=C6XI82_HIRBI|nr:MaoC family dehydratase [Hirschia baltica]ACT58908.1 MaoC domain protein dehydratase [Hirschia baltica ATCC 49814]